jgi:hypothetical protein
MLEDTTLIGQSAHRTGGRKGARCRAELGAKAVFVSHHEFGGIAAGPVPVRTLAHAARLIRVSSFPPLQCSFADGNAQMGEHMTVFRACIWNMVARRYYGPLSFRLLIQPLVAAGSGIRPDLGAPHARRTTFGWTVITSSDFRSDLLLEKWNHLKRLFFVAVLADVIYHIIQLRQIYLVRALIDAAIPAFPSYCLGRGLTTRIGGPSSRGPDLQIAGRCAKRADFMARA